MISRSLPGLTSWRSGVVTTVGITVKNAPIHGVRATCLVLIFYFIFTTQRGGVGILGLFLLMNKLKEWSRSPSNCHRQESKPTLCKGTSVPQVQAHGFPWTLFRPLESKPGSVALGMYPHLGPSFPICKMGMKILFHVMATNSM